MNNFQKIKVDGVEYYIVDSMQDFRAEDSFIHRKNKLLEYRGNGESKKHVGTYNGELGQKISHFFEYHTWGKEHFDKNKKRKTLESAHALDAIISQERCFFSKNNLLQYLNDAKTEYFKQEQKYHNNIEAFYEQRLKTVTSLKNETLLFSIYDASDNISQKQNRGYIRSDDAIWKLWRELILPSISYLSILKLIPIDNPKSKPFFYFRILLDYQFRSFVHPKIEQELNLEPILEKTQKTASRKGASKYRRAVIDHMPQCPFTKITETQLLIASHIKPYNICIKERREDQAIDYLNGLSFTPTYDKLFDQGYITFLDNGKLICGTQFSAYTWEKLKINPNAKNIMRIYPEGREEYLEYHRKYVFQDNLDDLV